MIITFNNGKTLRITVDEAVDLSENIRQGKDWVYIWRDGKIAFMIRVNQISFVS